EVVPRLGVEDAMAGEDDGTFSVHDLGGSRLELSAVAFEVRAEAGQALDDLRVRGMLGPRLLLERVLGDVDMDGTGAPGPGDMERLGDDPRQLVGITDEVVVLRHRQGDAVDVDL